MFFKKLMGWITQRSLILLIFLALLIKIVDSITAYLVYWFRPEFFLRHEQNPLTRAGYYYGEWQKSFISWAIFAGYILTMIVLTKYFKAKVFLNFLVISLIIWVIGGALSNVCAIIFDTIGPGYAIYSITNILGWILLFVGAVVQISVDDREDN